MYLQCRETLIVLTVALAVSQVKEKKMNPTVLTRALAEGEVGGRSVKMKQYRVSPILLTVALAEGEVGGAFCEEETIQGVPNITQSCTCGR